MVNRSRRSVPSRRVTHRRCCHPSSPTSAVMMKPFSYTMVAIRVTCDVHGPLYHRILRNFFLFVCFMNCKSSGGWALFQNFFLLLVLCISNTQRKRKKKVIGGLKSLVIKLELARQSGNEIQRKLDAIYLNWHGTSREHHRHFAFLLLLLLTSFRAELFLYGQFIAEQRGVSRKKRASPAAFGDKTFGKRRPPRPVLFPSHLPLSNKPKWKRERNRQTAPHKRRSS